MKVITDPNEGEPGANYLLAKSRNRKWIILNEYKTDQEVRQDGDGASVPVPKKLNLWINRWLTEQNRSAQLAV